MKKIMISACLLGQKVRYDGKHNLLDHPVIQAWKAEDRLLPICPEVLGGLPIPRPAAEVQSKFPILITTETGKDVTPEFLTGAERALEIAQRHNCCAVLMKAKSPSCGTQFIYDGSFSRQLVPGDGVAASELKRAGFPVFDENQLDALIELVTKLDQAEAA